MSINIGMDFNSQTDVIKTLAYFRRWIKERPDEFMLVDTIDDIRRAKVEPRLAVAFDLEGSESLDGELDMVPVFYDLGVRQMLLTYNKNSRAAGGCMDDDTGLTEFGRLVVEEMNRVGMLVDCSHTGFRSVMETMDIPSAPVIFSHSYPRALQDHRRNILDELIVACAGTAVVVGINGVGIFLGNDDTRSDRIVDHIAYVTDLVGSDHVGLGIDSSLDDEEFQEFVREHAEAFPSGDFEFTGFAELERTPEIAELLLDRGFSAPEALTPGQNQ